MTRKEKIIVSAHTGVLMCDFADVHEYIEKKLGRPVWIHELAYEKTQEEIKEKTRDDFLKVCKADETPEIVKVVRCKDCKHRKGMEYEANGKVVERYIFCELDGGDPHTDSRNADDGDWFCADGERREEREESR